jgi:catechol 2,3-dioxygenase-like lactoylglutathione lyase family enzyme
MDFKLELVGVPVTDVDRAKAFYVDQAGFTLDHDHAVSEDIRFVQLTPPGSACSIAIGKGLTQLAPGALDNLQVVVSDIHQARAELAERGVDVSEVDVLPGVIRVPAIPTATAGRCSSCPIMPSGRASEIAHRRAEEEGAEAFFPLRATTKSADSKRDARAAQTRGGGWLRRYQ